MTNQRTRIAYMLSAAGLGGMETHLLTLVRHLSRQDFAPVVILPEAAQHLSLYQRLTEMALPVRFHAMVRNKWDVGTFVSLTNLLRRCAPHIVHVHMAHTCDDLYRFIAARSAGCPVVMSTEHSASDSELSRSLRARLFKRAALALQDCVITVCDHVRDLLCKQLPVPLRKFVTIYNGVEIPVDGDSGVNPRREVRLELGVDVHTPLVGMVARIDPWCKRFDDFVAAADRIVHEVPAAHFVIVGDGDRRYRLALGELARQLGLANRLHFLGFRKDAARVIAGLDTLVLASDHEGFPMVTLEAMARGTPVVATRLGGLCEQIFPGETGYLVPPRDAPALAEAVLRVLRHPERSREIAERARRAVERLFNAQGMAAQTQALYVRLLVQKRVVDAHQMKSLAGIS